jgi:starvation-inducible DNA-binding protein
VDAGPAFFCCAIQGGAQLSTKTLALASRVCAFSSCCKNVLKFLYILKSPRKNFMKNKIIQMPINQKLETPTDLGNKAREAVAAAINPLVADAFALFVKTKNYHWHMSGSHYRDYHLLLDEQAGQIFAMIDVLAERVRKLGGLTIHSIGEISALQSVKDDNDSFVDPREMMRRLMKDNEELAAHMRAAHEVCDKYNDVATASFLEVFIDETERRTWFLYETQIG